MIDALQSSDGDLQAAVLSALLKKPDHDLLASIAQLVPALDVPARRLLLNDISLSEPIARVAIGSRDPSLRLNVIALMSEAGHPCFAYLLASGANDSTPLVRSRAGQALLNLARKYVHDPNTIARHIAPAVTMAMKNFRLHGSPQVLQAAVVLGFQCPREVMLQLDRPANQLTRQVMATLKSMPPSETGEFVLSALRFPLLAQTARAYISQATWPTLAELARHEHYLSLKPVRDAMAEIRHLSVVAEDPPGLADLPAGLQPGTLRLLMACGMSKKLARTLLTIALGGEPALALAAWPFVLTQDEQVTELALMALHSGRKELQGLAAARIMAAGVDVNLTEHLLGSLAEIAEP
ncbi:MAG: hypothetical protein HQ546_05725, partial [Planctomycetes bacterium]|nr:hypothetical protein [Planctomycetota bacterium]